jgi:hypothetical protein
MADTSGQQQKQQPAQKPVAKEQKQKAPAKKKVDLNALPKHDFIEHRIKIWDEQKKKHEEELAGKLQKNRKGKGLTIIF